MKPPFPTNLLLAEARPGDFWLTGAELPGGTMPPAPERIGRELGQSVIPRRSTT
jgi:hypothetical protein